MREKALLFSNYLLFIFFTLLLLGIQSTLWLLVFGDFPPAHFWVPTIVFWAIYRNFFEGVTMTYLITMVICSYSVAPLGLMLFINSTCFALIYLLRTRLYWPGTTFIMLANGVFALAHPIVHYSFSHGFETTPIQDFLFFEWALRALLTTLLSLVIYPIFLTIDRITQKEIPTETGGQLL